MNERKRLIHAKESLVVAMGREQNTLEFYSYLAKTIRHTETKKFFQDIVRKESDDIKQTEAFLEEIENDLKDLDKK